MNKIFHYVFVVIFLPLCFFVPGSALAYQPRLVYLQPNLTQIQNPEISQAFYDELKGKPQDYFIDSSKNFELYINLLVPEPANRDGRYSATIFSVSGDEQKQVAVVDGTSFDWKQYYESFGRDYYLRGPEFTKQVPAGKYKIEVYSKDNLGKYVLAVGDKESFDAQFILNAYWQLPLLKITFFKSSVLQFFLDAYFRL